MHSMQQRKATLVADNIQVSFRRGGHRYTSFKELVISKLFGRKSENATFQALKGVKIELFPGEAVGLIGHNGSGKSTLLKVLCGVLKPTVGQVHYEGTLASLIELSAGFDGELSGRENIFLNLALLGISGKKARDAIAGILEFAEVEEFADEPVKNYSSGMQARLGFACATAFRPDILLVDEVLAVGDENFQRKCLAKMHEMKRAGTSIVLVSHDLNAVERFCERAYVLDHGNKVFDGSSPEAIAQFRALLLEAENKKQLIELSSDQPEAKKIKRIECSIQGSNQSSQVKTGQPWSVAISVFGEDLENLTAGISVLESSSETHLGGLMADETLMGHGIIGSLSQINKRDWVFAFKSNPFHSGRYYVDLRLYSKQRGELVAYSKRAANFDVIFEGDTENPHKNFIAMGALL